MRRLIKFLDKAEDRTRGHLSRVPIIYAVVGGVTIVLFWRGVWNLSDSLELMGGFWGFVFNPLVSLIFSILILLGSGLFVSFFIGDRIILSGLRHEKKVEEKTESEVREEEAMIVNLNTKINEMKRELEEIKLLIKK